MPGFQSLFFLVFLHHFVLAKFATSSIRIETLMLLVAIFSSPAYIWNKDLEPSIQNLLYINPGFCMYNAQN